MSDTTFTYGPSALATPANAVTVIRLLVSPLLFSMISHDPYTWPVFVLWVALASTDGIDGWIARRHGTTRSGAFLDPLADKVLVLGALFSLASIGRFTWVPVAIVACRELFISLYRVYWGRRGLAVPARKSAKAKTVMQSVAIGLALFPPFADRWLLGDIALWISVVLALVSATQYVVDGRKSATTLGHL